MVTSLLGTHQCAFLSSGFIVFYLLFLSQFICRLRLPARPISRNMDNIEFLNNPRVIKIPCFSDKSVNTATFVERPPFGDIVVSRVQATRRPQLMLVTSIIAQATYSELFSTIRGAEILLCCDRSVLFISAKPVRIRYSRQEYRSCYFSLEREVILR